MTFSTANNKATYTGNGVTVAFSFPYLFKDNDHLKVYLDGVLSGSGYSITGAGNPAGGTVTFSTAPANGVSVVLLRQVPYVQETDIVDFDGNPAQVTEDQFDLCVMMASQLNEIGARTITVPVDVTITSNEVSGTIDSTTRLMALSTSGPSTIELADISTELDTVITGVVSGQVLTWNGTNWVNATSSFTSATANINMNSIYKIVNMANPSNSQDAATKAYVDGIVDSPKGRLTLTTATPITTVDVTAATTLYYTPYQGNTIALYTGSVWAVSTLSEISIAVPATTNQMYDVFVYSNSGTLTLELTAWTNDTTRATALTLQNGVLVKSGATTRRYVGSIRTTSVSGQLEDSKKYRGVWNYYNRVGKALRANDATASWTYATATWRAANSNTTLGTARVGLVVGVSEDSVDATYQCAAVSGGGAEGMMGIGINSTTTDSSTSSGVSGQANVSSSQADYDDFLAIGFNYIQALEYATGATMTFYGVKNTAFRSGLSGKVNC